MEDLVVFKNITKKYPGVVALDDVSFPIHRGEIHAIVGENGAGKSTLMHILGGEIQPDRGEVIYRGKPVVIPDPHAARLLGISIVYQELKLCPNLSVVENINLGRERRTNWKEMCLECGEALQSLGAHINPRSLVKNLSIAEQQMVEIAKAISLRSEVLILDEPNSALTLNETENLFRNLLNLQGQGVTILFISHRLEEVFKISDRISVLRDGKYLATYPTAEITVDQVVTLIAGKKLVNELSQKTSRNVEGNRLVLEAKNLSRGRYFQDVSFQLYEKEILGIYGLQGSGRTELLESIFGTARLDHGEIFLFGKKVTINNPKQALKSGFAMVPEDRRRTGLFFNLDVKDNINMSNPEEIAPIGIIRKKKVVDIAKKFVNDLSIKVGSVSQMVRNLSGGNQQKVIISRWLAAQPKIFLVDELTRGIDVGSKAEIYKILQRLRNEGLSILLVSSELQEVLAECDRILVMRNGALVANLFGDQVDKETVLKFALKG
ncbi:MAG: sugar ABC transporter ATP-binding protein [Atribacterota bacterium]